MKKATRKLWLGGGTALGALLLIWVGSQLFPNEMEKAESEHSSPSGSVEETTISDEFTPFDVATAKRVMDGDGDGSCNACGMRVDQCIASGMLECPMDPDAQIGLLGSAHIHTRLRIYLNGSPLDLSGENYQVRSKFARLEGGQGNIVHIHAKGVPVKFFFESLGMKFDKECFTLDSSEQFCNQGDRRLRFYVNGKPNEQYGEYVFKDSDEILIRYGADR